MSIKEFLSEKEKEELEIKLEKEIQEYKEKMICKQKFIYYLKKKCNFIEFCYLYSTYIGEVEAKPKLPSFNIDEIDIITDFNDYNYDIPKKTFNYKIQNVKRIKSIENMALKGKNIKKRKK